MSELPPGWCSATVEEIGTPPTPNVDPSRFKEELFHLFSVPSYSAGEPELLPGSEIGSTKQEVKPGDVLICKIVPHINRVWVVPSAKGYRQIASSEWIVVRNDLVEPDFLRIAFSGPAFRALFLRDLTGVGGSLTRARPQTVKKISIPIPPLEEQRRIVAHVKGLLARCRIAKEELARIPALIDRQKRSLLDSALNGSLTEEWRDETDISAWKTGTLKSLATDFSYGSSAKSQKTGKVPVLRMGNIQDGKIDWSDLVYTSNKKEIEKYRLQPGDVLFNRTNSPALVGKTALYSGERVAIYAGYLIRVRCQPELMPEYLTHALNSPVGREYCWQVKSDAVSQSNINAKKLAAFTFPLPSLDEQAQIVSAIDRAFHRLDLMRAEHLRASTLVEALAETILGAAMRGELVPQDPGDEPATALLERARSRRAEVAEINIRQVKSKTRPKKKGTVMPIKRADVDDEYLSKTLKDLGGRSQAKDLWQRSDMEIDEFYKLLRNEIRAGRVTESADKQTLELSNAA